MVLLSIGARAPETTTETLELPATGKLAERYLGKAPSAYYLVRPDQVIAARWTSVSGAEVDAQVKAIWGR